MITIILAGGFGSRLGSITAEIPKPMVEIGERPLIWHVMNIYAAQGHKQFILCLGYKGNVIREYFHNYRLYTKDCTLQLGCEEPHNTTMWTDHLEGALVSLCETGLNTETGGRLSRVRPYLSAVSTKNIMVTYTDGLSDINLSSLLRFHEDMGLLGTVTAVHPPSRFGELSLEQSHIVAFKEKPQISSGWINGGFMVFKMEAFSYLDPNKSLEEGLITNLVAKNQLAVYRHEGFWQCIDHQRELDYLNTLWNTGQAKWKKWV